MLKNNLIVTIDPGKYICQALICQNGKIMESFPFENVSFSGMKKLLDKTLIYGKNPVFVFEATNVFWKPLYFHITSGYQCFTVSASQTVAYRKTRIRKTKTDKIYYKEILEIYLKGEAHPTKIISQHLASLKELTILYTHLVDTKTKLCYRIREYIYQLFPEWENTFKDIFCKTSLYLLEKQLSSPQLLSKIRRDKLAGIIKKVSYGKFGISLVNQLKENAQNSFGIPLTQQALSFNLSLLVKSIKSSDNILIPLENNIKNIFLQVPQHLLTVLGVAVIPASSFISELGNPNDFSNADKVIAWFGLDIVWKSSAGKGKGYSTGSFGHVSKTGTPYGRKWVYVAAGEFVRHFPPAKQKYLKIFNEHHIHKSALIPICADLTKILFAMYRDGTPFDPSRYH